MAFTRTQTIINNTPFNWPLTETDIPTEIPRGNGITSFAFLRQGGDASGWSANGSTDYAPSAFKIQSGRRLTSGSPASDGAISFGLPEAFGDGPIGVFVSAINTSTGTPQINNIIANGQPVSSYPDVITIRWRDYTANTYTYMDFAWFAIGSE